MADGGTMTANYVLEAGAACSLGGYLQGLGGSCLLLCDRHPMDDLLACMREGILAQGDVSSVEVLRVERPHCEKGRARELARDISARAVDIVIAFGSSKILDLARATLRCLQPDRPALVLVTSVVASNASVGSLAVMYGEDGLPNGFWKLDRAPELVVIDPTFVLDAPARLLAAAMGDQLASSLEATDGARMAGQWGSGENDHVHAIETIFAHGVQAMDELARREQGTSLMKVLRAVTYYTPSQERSASARMCHVLGAALSADPRVMATHGEVVAACIPAELVLSDREDDLGRWAYLLRGLGLPACLADLGIDVADEGDVRRLVDVAASCLLGEGSVIAADREGAVRAVLRAERLARD